MKTFLFLLPFVEAVLFFSGAPNIEELSESELERYTALSEHPIDLNLASRSKLLSSGLLSTYQVASLLDYRDRTGFILSYSELALIDGFNEEISDALKVFTKLKVGDAPGQTKEKGLRQSLTLRGSSRTGQGVAGKVKYEASLGETAELRWTSRTTYSDPKPGIGTISAAYYGKSHLGKMIAGNYEARFGQGLALWSAFSLSGYTTASSFRRSGTGLSPSGSATSTLCGLAADWNFGMWTVATAYSFKGNMPIFSLSHSSRLVSIGMTATHRIASTDWKISLPDKSIYGELAASYSGAISALCGFMWIPSYGKKFSLLARYPSPDRRTYGGMAMGWESRSLTSSIDAGARTDTGAQQYKLFIHYHPEFETGDFIIRPSARLNGRYRPQDGATTRIDLRGDIAAEYGSWTASARYNALWCRDLAWMWYAEIGRKSEELSAYLRGGLFLVDNWDDRIYVYERDAPGNFNVPALYGRGWNGSAYVAWHISRSHSLWLRLSTINYPWNLTEKPGRTECAIQWRWKSS